MTNFSKIAYHRPDLVEAQKKYNSILIKIKEATAVNDLVSNMSELSNLRNELTSQSTLVAIRHSLNTKDAYYETEQQFWDENSPLISELENELQKALVQHPLKNEIINHYGSHIIRLAEVAMNTYKPEIADLLVEENKLMTEYGKLLATAQIQFDDKLLNLSTITPYIQHKERATRLKAVKAKHDWFEKNSEILDTIFDKLVKTRTHIANKLGYKTFTPLAYARLNRTDYTEKEIEVFRKQVRQYIVPLATKLRQAQAKRLQLSDFNFIDENLFYANGNATPKGTPDQLVARAQAMYRDLDTEMGEFFDFMMQQELMDLVARDNKAVGGYCTYIPSTRSPFIFSNFNGTTHDIDVLTHEAGHAFQVFSSRDMPLPDYYWPTLEACEIHSMSMEYFAYPYIHTLVGETDAVKYKYEHISSAITFLPYGVAVDAFQHLIYENPHWTALQRKSCWNEIEKQYLPSRKYNDLPYYNTGGIWQAQRHIYENPFYYIDYTLASICAFQYFILFNKNRKSAIDSYKYLCKLGGSKPFSQLTNEVGLKSPFDENSLQNIVKEIETYIDSFDISSLT